MAVIAGYGMGQVWHDFRWGGLGLGAVTLGKFASDRRQLAVYSVRSIPPGQSAVL